MNYILVFIISLLVTILTNRLLLAFAKNLGTRGVEKIQVRWASTAVPSLGGIGFYVIFLGLLCIIGLSNLEFVLISKEKFVGAFIAISLGFAIGFADDTYNTNPILKAIGQFSCALVLFLFDIQIIIDINYPIINFIISTLWVVGLMNSINMLDNMDGITASVSVMILVSFLSIVLLTSKDLTAVTFFVGMIGSLVGFLYHNWHPAKMYMGDAGSQFLGVFLAIYGIEIGWNSSFLGAETSYLSQIALPFLIFLVPLIDTVTVIYKRLQRGVSPFQGGSDHTTHHFVYFGLTEIKVLSIFALLNLVSLAMIILVILNPFEERAFQITALLYSIVLFFGIQYIYTKGGIEKEKAGSKRKRKRKAERRSIYDKLSEKVINRID